MDTTIQSVINKAKCLLELGDPNNNMTNFLPNEIKCCLVQINSTMSAFNIFYLKTLEDLISNIAYGELNQNFENLPDIQNITYLINYSKSASYVNRVFKEIPAQKDNFMKLGQLIDKYYSPIELTKLMGVVNGL